MALFNGEMLLMLDRKRDPTLPIPVISTNIEARIVSSMPILIIYEHYII